MHAKIPWAATQVISGASSEVTITDLNLVITLGEANECTGNSENHEFEEIFKIFEEWKLVLFYLFLLFSRTHIRFRLLYV